MPRSTASSPSSQSGSGNLNLILVCIFIDMLGIGLIVPVMPLLVGQFVAVLFLAAFGVLFGWQIGGYLQRNAPGRYALDPLPSDLLP